MVALIYARLMLKKLVLLRERVENWKLYPFSVPVLRNLQDLVFISRICFFTGENGTGKSTLLEAIGAHYGFGSEGGNRNFTNNSTHQNQAVSPLVKALRLSFDRKTGMGFFLRAESFFNVATHIEELGVADAYGGVQLHEQSHGESFLALLFSKFRTNGLFLLDEPEAALSPQRQLSFMVLIHDVLQQHSDAQFIISTHSPLLLGFPGAQIISFDEGLLHTVSYEQTSPAQIVKSFINNREAILEELFKETPFLTQGE